MPGSNANCQGSPWDSLADDSATCHVSQDGDSNRPILSTAAAQAAAHYAPMFQAVGKKGLQDSLMEETGFDAGQVGRAGCAAAAWLSWRPCGYSRPADLRPAHQEVRRVVVCLTLRNKAPRARVVR